MKIKIKTIQFVILIILSISLKSQSVLNIVNDTNIVVGDFIPDTIAVNPNIDNIEIDINQDGFKDARFFIKMISLSNAPFISNISSNCQYTILTPDRSDSLSINSVIWKSGETHWL